MRKIISILFMFAIALFTVSSCKKKGGGDDTKKDIVVTIIQEGIKDIDSIPPVAFSLPIVWTEVLDSQLNTILAANGINKDQIKHAYAKGMVIDMLGSSQTFNFINDSVKIYVDKVSGTNPVLIASKYGIPANVTTISFDVISSDVKEFFLSDLRQMTLKFNTKPNEAIYDNTQIHYKMTFDVTYTP